MSRMQTSRLLIVGAGGHGCVVADAAEASGRWSEIQFVDSAFPQLERVLEWPVVDNGDTLAQFRGRVDAAIVALGQNDLRMQLLTVLEEADIPLATIVHPAACVSRYADLGEGTVVLAGSVVNARARMGRGCIVNTGSTVDHDCELADGVHIAPGAHLAAHVVVGRCSWVGVGAAVRENMAIGENVVVGAGAAVVRDVAEGAVVAGVPTKPIRATRHQRSAD